MVTLKKNKIKKPKFNYKPKEFEFFEEGPQVDNYCVREK